MFKCFTSVRSAFLTGSLAFNIGVVVDGGLVKKEMMSCAACLKKNSSLIFGKGTVVGKN